MSKTNIFFVLLLTILLCAPLYGDEFKLINGNIIKGELIGENDKSVTVKVEYGIIKIDADPGEIVVYQVPGIKCR